jgi:hypothetical protein
MLMGTPGVERRFCVVHNILELSKIKRDGAIERCHVRSVRVLLAVR